MKLTAYPRISLVFFRLCGINPLKMYHAPKDIFLTGMPFCYSTLITNPIQINHSMNTIKNFSLAAAVFCLALGFGTSCNNSPSQDSKEHAEEMNDEKLDREGEKDADRVVELHCGNLYEIQASQEAMAKASTADVKKLAGMMVEAHSRMDKDLQALAMRKNITLPGDITNEQKRDMDKLAEKTGIDYDKEYIDQMENKHNDAERLLEKMADKSEDGEIKQMASTTLPEVRSHKDMIEATKNNVKDMKQDARKDERDDRKNNRSTSSNPDTHDGRAHEAAK
jgi:putative membrane protein